MKQKIDENDKIRKVYHSSAEKSNEDRGTSDEEEGILKTYLFCFDVVGHCIGKMGS